MVLTQPALSPMQWRTEVEKIKLGDVSWIGPEFTLRWDDDTVPRG
jgi:hypothetical protein